MRLKSQMSLSELKQDENYSAFVDKSKTHATTDDCVTPPEIYDLVAGYVTRRYGIDKSHFMRPFWPKRDYRTEDYPEGCCVVDNPPFSILSKIIKDYLDAGIEFFLFAPTMTLMSGRATRMRCNHIVCHASITYANGAKVPTSFVTSLDKDGTILESDPALSKALEGRDKELQSANKARMPKYVYPDNVIHAAKVQWFAAHDTPYKLNARDCVPISKLDAMGGKTIFGGGLLLGTRAAAERAAAERAAAERAAAIKWKLSERELAMVAAIDETIEREER